MPKCITLVRDGHSLSSGSIEAGPAMDGYFAFRRKILCKPCRFHQPGNISLTAVLAWTQFFRLLKGSDVPNDNLETFMRANIIFWLIGATDGHAKNFSIFLSPGGRFRMTPLYDVLSAQPSLDAGQIQRKKFKLAMSAGKNRHYEVTEIMPKHFFQTADAAGIESGLVTTIFNDLIKNAVRVTDTVVKDLPAGFPQAVSVSIQAALGHRIELIKAG
jgi:serine/threonine-protein kinase HipA